jgi:hypothetical protein
LLAAFPLSGYSFIRQAAKGKFYQVDWKRVWFWSVVSIIIKGQLNLFERTKQK